MRKNLSSKFTYGYKFGIPCIWSVIVLWATIVMFSETGNAGNFLVMALIVPVVWFTWHVKFVSYDTEHIIVSNGRLKRTYELEDFKRITEPHNFYDPYFKIELIGEDGSVDQFKFLARFYEQLQYTLSGQFTGRILELKNIKEQQPLLKEIPHADALGQF